MDFSEEDRDTDAVIAGDSFYRNQEKIFCKKFFGKNMFGEDNPPDNWQKNIRKAKAGYGSRWINIQ